MWFYSVKNVRCGCRYVQNCIKYSGVVMNYSVKKLQCNIFLYIFAPDYYRVIMHITINSELSCLQDLQ